MEDYFTDTRLADAAADQWGFVTTTQARSLGVTPQQLSRLQHEGALQRVRHGVYRINGVPEHTDDEYRAEWLAFEPGRFAYQRLRDSTQTAIVSHRSAAVMHGLGDLEAESLEFTVPVRRRLANPAIRLHVGTVDPADWEFVNGLPVTTIEHTLAELARIRVDGGHLAGAVRDALTVRHADLADLAGRLSPYAKYYGAPLGDGFALIKQLLDTAGIPTSARDTATLADADGVVFGRVRHHRGVDDREADRERDTAEIAHVLGLDRLTVAAREALLRTLGRPPQGAGPLDLTDVRRLLDRALGAEQQPSRHPERGGGEVESAT